MGGKALPALPTSTPTPTPTSTPTPTPTSTSSETPTVVTPHIETSEEKIKRLISEIGAIDKSISSLESNRKQVRGKLTHRMSKLEKEQDNKLKQEISAKEKEKNALENEIKNLKNEKKKSSKEQGGTGGFFPQGRM